MKRMVSVALLAMVFGGYTLADAALYDRGADNLGNHLIYDSDLNITWYDYNSGTMTWTQAMSWVQTLRVTVNGVNITRWRLPHNLPVNGSTCYVDCQPPLKASFLFLR